MHALIQKLAWAVTNPTYTVFNLCSRCVPELLYQRYSKLSRQAGLEKVYFVLSFDCDTEDDIDVVWDVHARLQDMGVTPVYAVPGDLLRKGVDTYSRIKDSGSQFINHGDREHTFFDKTNKRHASCFFYNEQSHEELRKDIVDAHKTLKEVLGVTARGFRTPHFGTFQKPEHLQFLYGVLKELGYAFTTSTLPIKGFRQGAIIDVGGLKELPVSGTATRPLQILDTWGYFESPDRRHTPTDYLNESRLLAERISGHGAGIINIYADPSHVHGKELFFQAIEAFLKVGTPVRYDEIPGLT